MRQKLCFLLISLVFICSGATAGESRMLVRIYLESPEHVMVLDDMHLDFASLAITDHADVVVTPSEHTEIQRRGFQTEIIQREEDWNLVYSGYGKRASGDSNMFERVFSRENSACSFEQTESLLHLKT